MAAQNFNIDALLMSFLSIVFDSSEMIYGALGSLLFGSSCHSVPVRSKTTVLRLFSGKLSVHIKKLNLERAS